MNLQLKNQTFRLTHNGKPIAELNFDEVGAPSLGPGFSPIQVKVFLAVMTLIIGEYPAASDNLSEITILLQPPARKKDP